MNYYNDFDKNAAQWLRNLIAAGLLPPGDVDNRPIQEVQPHELTGYTQCHFFAGIGGWPLALQIAGVGADRPLWTGSCPCQPFSVAGKGLGVEDERHLWPEFKRLIAECNPPKVFGEQVAGKDGLSWLAGVRSDLEALGYGVGAADLCAAGIRKEASVLLAGRNGLRRERVNLGPAHIRQRLYWVADSHSERRDGINPLLREGQEHLFETAGGCIGSRRLADPAQLRRGKELTHRTGNSKRAGTEGEIRRTAEHCTFSGMGNPELRRCEQDDPEKQTGANAADIWGGFTLVPCGDGKARRIEPGLMPLVDGISGRVAQIRGYGNAIHPGLAAEFIKAYFEAADDCY